MFSNNKINVFISNIRNSQARLQIESAGFMLGKQMIQVPAGGYAVSVSVRVTLREYRKNTSDITPDCALPHPHLLT